VALAALAVFSTAVAQARPRERRVEPAAVQVRYAEGTVGFLELRTAAGALLAHGDLLQPKLGIWLRVFAMLVGKAPPDSDVWIVTDDVPAFVRFEGPPYSGPVWRLNLTSPSWPP